MKVYIAYGWPEGKWHGKQLVDALTKSNYDITDRPEQADVVVAHSAGCYMLPSDLKAKLILLIDLPNWPNKPLIKCTAEKISLENKNKEWFKKTFFHLIYAITQPIRLSKVYKSYKNKSLPDYSRSHVILVHNEMDTYMNEDACQELANRRKWFLKNLKGQHDDVWQNPQPYIKLIREYAV